MTDFQSLMQSLRNPETRFASRVITGLLPEEERAVRMELAEGFERIRVAPFVKSDGFVSAPGRVFSEIAESAKTIRAAGKAVLLTGLDGYLSIVASADRRECFEHLRRLAEKAGSDATVTLLRHDWPECGEVFSHPRLRQNGDWTVLRHSSAPAIRLTLVSGEMRSRFPNVTVFNGLSEWLESAEEGLPAGEAVVAVGFNGRYPFRVLDGDAVMQSPTERDFLRDVCSLDVDILSDETVQWILDNTRGTDIGTELLARFFPDGTGRIAEEILERYSHLVSPAEKAAFFAVVTNKSSSDGYLGRVLAHCGEKPDTFLENYLKPPSELVGDSRASEWADERKRAVQAWADGRSSASAAVENFVDATQSLPAETVKPWLNLGLPCEEREWLRRAMSGEETAKNESRLLRTYLADQALGDAGLDGYFAEYRRQKAANLVEGSFCTAAATTVVPTGIVSRANAFSEIQQRENAFVLVVDALGAEWIPAVLEFANTRHLKVADCRCVRAILPTTTDFNPVEAEAGSHEAGFLKIDDFDQTIIHAKGLSGSEGFYKELTYVRDVVMQKVDDGLKTHECVVLTADHGASRLAVLAHEARMDETLVPGKDGIPDGLDVEDWRYARKEPELVVRDARLAVTTDGEWAVVRGYNRFSRQGGTGFEVHGGATPEELLVPFIVFERGVFTQNYKKPSSAAPSGNGQIEEIEGFDI